MSVQTRPTDRYQIRDTEPDETLAVMTMIEEAFGAVWGPEIFEIERMVFEPERNHLIIADGEIVANVGAFTRELTVPGAVLPAAHVTAVAVRPEHRRRGLLTRLMTHQLRTAPEAIAVLWASEGRIYQRYGYGLATRNLSMAIDTREVTLTSLAPPAPGQVRRAVAAELPGQPRQVYERLRADRPGWSGREGAWWDARLADPAVRREGATPLRATVYEGSSGVDGYALWRIRPGRSPGGPDGTVEVHELVAATPEAYAGLWRYLLAVDLTRHVSVPFAALDEPLQFLVSDPQRLVCSVGEGVWVRVLDVAAALAGRRYAAPVDVVVEVTDGVLPDNAGRYRLSAGADGSAVCARTTEAPDLACDVAVLGSVYLGGVSLVRLAEAGRVTELRPGALRAASTAFGWYREPSSIEIF